VCVVLTTTTTTRTVLLLVFFVSVCKKSMNTKEAKDTLYRTCRDLACLVLLIAF
jgi:hypothetical protein